MRLPGPVERWRTDTGRYVLGVRAPLQTSDATSESTSFLASRLGFRVQANSSLTAGVVLWSPEGGHYLTMHVGHGVFSKLFRLVPLDRNAAWTRTTTTVHPVTKQKMASAPLDLGPVLVAVEPLGEANDAVRVSTNLYRIITNADLHLGDVVDGLTINRVQKLLGVTVAEAA